MFVAQFFKVSKEQFLKDVGITKTLKEKKNGFHPQFFFEKNAQRRSNSRKHQNKRSENTLIE